MLSNAALRERADLSRFYRSVRDRTDRLCDPLAAEDQVIQSMPDVSPTRWHRAHTTWFFETFVLKPATPGYEPVHSAYGHLFNSYYQGVGDPFPRARRGILSRPTVAEVTDYRRIIDRRMRDLLDGGSKRLVERFRDRVVLGLNHEEQHQELLLMDIKHVFAQNPLCPVYREDRSDAAEGGSSPAADPIRFLAFDGGEVEIGHEGVGFAYDNERPRHAVLLQPFEIADRLVTNREYLAFISDGGYERPELWLSLGFDRVRAENWRAPLYWRERDGRWFEFTLRGERELDLDAPVAHVSYFEADAFARYCDARLPTEAEWEYAASRIGRDGALLEDEVFHPSAAPRDGESLRQAFGDLWEWTMSSYAPYPGFRPWAGAIGEYNGKFMCNQYVLRGGSFATPRDHVRPTYRNFFPPEARWAFTGIRLAR